MPTIHDLPLETIGHIITIAHHVGSDDRMEQRVRRHFYLDASLVCRDWTPFAQRALWRFVEADEAGVTLLVESGGAGRYPIDKLVLHFVDSDTSLEPLGTLLSSVRGVRDIKLERCSMVGSWLSGDNWRDLKSLTLDDTMVADTELPVYQFALTHLDLQYEVYFSDETLVALSRQLTITSLGLYLCGSAVEVLHYLLPLAPQLVRLDLKLDMLDDDDAAVPRIVDPFLKRCTHLKHLTFMVQDTPSVIHLPLPLESWALAYCHEANVASILDVLDSKATAVSKLKHLCIQPERAADTIEAACEAQSWERWPELEEVCRQKKIKLIVGLNL